MFLPEFSPFALIYHDTSVLLDLVFSTTPKSTFSVYVSISVGGAMVFYIGDFFCSGLRALIASVCPPGLGWRLLLQTPFSSKKFSWT